jgi:hypothetical protein
MEIDKYARFAQILRDPSQRQEARTLARQRLKESEDIRRKIQML